MSPATVQRTGDTHYSPFLDEILFLDEAQLSPAGHARTVAGSPFVTAYRREGEVEISDPQSEQFVTLLGELRDEDLREAFLEVAHEYRALRDDGFTHEAGDPEGEARRIDAYLAPVLREVDLFFETTVARLDGISPEALTDEEIDSAIDGYAPSEELSPAFENLFGFVKKAVKKATQVVGKVAKAGVQAAAKLGFGPILKKLWGYIPKLLRHWLERVVSQVPAALRPAAQELSRKLLGRVVGTAAAKPATPPAAGSAVTSAAIAMPDGESAIGTAVDGADGPTPPASQIADPAPDVAEELLQEFEASLAEALLAEDEEALARADFAPASLQVTGHDPLAELDRAREAFTRQISTLRDGTDPTPHVEQFVPAVLPLAAKVIGKDRLRRLIVPVVSRLIRNVVGQQHSEALAKVLVDKGLRLVNLEAPPEDDQREAASAVTRTVEDTVRRVAELPGHVLEDEAMLEGFVLEAFEQSAAANLPVLTDEAYLSRPDLREDAEGFWTWQPSTGRRRYNKFTRVFDDVVITPHMARAIRTFGNVPLSAFLTDQFGLPQGATTRCRLHLYEGIPGTSLPLISRLERQVPGLGAAPWSHVQLHPLTPAAAGILLGRPRLGRALAPAFLADRNRVAVGGRYYYPEIPGARLRFGRRHGTGRALPRSSQVAVALDFVARSIKVCVYVSEADAQEITRKLRLPSGTPAAAVTTLRPLIESGVRYALSGDAPARIRIVHPAIDPAMARGAALKRLPRAAYEGFSGALAARTFEGVAQLFRQDWHSFAARTEEDADGVTVIVKIDSALILSKLGDALTGRARADDATVHAAVPASVTAAAASGFRRE